MYAFKYCVEINWAEGVLSHGRTVRVRLYSHVEMKDPSGVAACLLLSVHFSSVQTKA